ITGVRNCIPICNGTIALEIIIRALDLKHEVIVPSNTFIATAHALQWQEITPVFCDIDPDSYNLDPSKIERMITPRTTGIIGVHVWGRPCDIETIAYIAEKYNLKMVFDAAHAFGCSYNGKMIGNFGDAEVFSFHATKFISTFEGGAIATNNDELAQKIRLMKNFGFAGLDNVIYIGTNGKMSEISAAMGITSLEIMDDIIEVNRRNYNSYYEMLGDIPGIKLMRYDGSERYNYQYIIAEIDEDKTGLTRDELVKILHAENLLVRRYFYPGCHRMEPYRSFFPHADLVLPQTTKILQNVISFPNGKSINKNDIETIYQLLSFIVRNSPEIRSKLQEK
ncbi:MAG TPA: dTDP-4-dehydro-6-deoxyglucose aminotransferase, partial [Bacteroidetes bacterium]|nr:dTDP-4-dehydro-6-deoxyglucose aminotransferase [Bacteroidota bacterium]